MTAILMSIVVFHTLASLVLMLISAGENILSMHRGLIQRRDQRADAQRPAVAGYRNNLQLQPEAPESVARAA